MHQRRRGSFGANRDGEGMSRIENKVVEVFILSIASQRCAQKDEETRLTSARLDPRAAACLVAKCFSINLSALNSFLHSMQRNFAPASSSLMCFLQSSCSLLAYDRMNEIQST